MLVFSGSIYDVFKMGFTSKSILFKHYFFFITPIMKKKGDKMMHIINFIIQLVIFILDFILDFIKL